MTSDEYDDSNAYKSMEYEIACEIADEYDDVLRHAIKRAEDEEVSFDEVIRMFLALYQGRYEWEEAVANILEESEFKEDEGEDE